MTAMMNIYFQLQQRSRITENRWRRLSYRPVLKILTAAAAADAAAAAAGRNNNATPFLYQEVAAVVVEVVEVVDVIWARDAAAAARSQQGDFILFYFIFSSRPSVRFPDNLVESVGL